MTNIVDLCISAGLSRPCFIKTITGGYDLVDSDAFNVKFQEALELFDYADRLTDNILFAFRLEPREYAMLPMVNYQNHRVRRANIDRRTLDWRRWVRQILKKTCPPDLSWRWISFVLCHDRIIIRLYRTDADRKAFRSMHRIIVTSYSNLFEVKS